MLRCGNLTRYAANYTSVFWIFTCLRTVITGKSKFIVFSFHYNYIYKIYQNWWHHCSLLPFQDLALNGYVEWKPTSMKENEAFVTQGKLTKWYLMHYFSFQLLEFFSLDNLFWGIDIINILTSYFSRTGKYISVINFNDLLFSKKWTWFNNL